MLAVIFIEILINYFTNHLKFIMKNPVVLLMTCAIVSSMIAPLQAQDGHALVNKSYSSDIYAVNKIVTDEISNDNLPIIEEFDLPNAEVFSNSVIHIKETFPPTQSTNEHIVNYVNQASELTALLTLHSDMLETEQSGLEYYAEASRQKEKLQTTIALIAFIALYILLRLGKFYT